MNDGKRTQTFADIRISVFKVRVSPLELGIQWDICCGYNGKYHDRNPIQVCLNMAYTVKPFHSRSNRERVDRQKPGKNIPLGNLT